MALPKRYSKEIEEKWQRVWEERGIHGFNKDSEKPTFVIDSPPPFTSGKLHMGHVLSYSYFDFVARFKRMKGFNVLYPQGWDAQGFPTEVKVEKKYGRLPKEEFRKKCIEFSNEMIKNMKKQMKAMGFSPDWRFEYVTTSPSYHKIIQLSVLEMYEKGLIYREKHPVLFCPYCSSAIAKAETEEKEEETTLYYIEFEYEDGQKKKPLIIATTRPELLHACVAVVVGKKYEKLDGKTAITPFGKRVKIFHDKDVKEEFGTGAVMVCTYGDKQDLVWQKRYKLDVVEGIDKRGKIKNSPFYDGFSIKEARKKVIKALEEKSKIIKKEKIKHTVKIHDRCKKEVELLPSMEWFAKVREHKEKIKEIAKKVKWVPSFTISHLFHWIDSLDWDWVISRDRVFGTPIPFYVCECGEVRAVEKEKLPFYPENAEKIVCKCGKEMKPEEKVFDVWIDSSVTPLIISGWKVDEELFSKTYPNSLRPQGVEIIRTWAFYTLYRCFFLTGEIPWKEILLNGNVLGVDGKKMSKSLGNVIDPDELLNNYSADAIRQWAAMSGVLAKDRPFSYEDINFAKQFLNKLWNASRFIEIALEGALEGEERISEVDVKELEEVDKWILIELEELIKDLEKRMESYDFRNYIVELQNFVWKKFCDFYIEYVKWRVYSGKKKREAQYTLYIVLSAITRALFPISPHISEEISSVVLKNQKTITELGWMSIEVGLTKEEKEKIKERVEMLNKIISEIRNYKARNQLSLKEELERVTIHSPIEISSVIEEIKNVGRVKEIELKSSNELRVEF